jgi:tight adherence protein C
MLQLLSENAYVRLSALFALFLFVTFATYSVASSYTARQQARRRLEAGAPSASPQPQSEGSLRASETNSAWINIINAIEKSGVSLGDTKDDDLRRKLASAGFKSTYAPRIYTLIRLALVIALPLLLLAAMWFGGAQPSGFRLYFILLVAAALGLYVPALVVRAKADRRQRELINAFPDALDLMLVCVEAGLGLEAAFDRVGREMINSHPRLAREFGTVVLELRAGRSREDALRRMADRSGTDEIRAFATLLIQSTRLGSSIAQTLRVYASEMRERRRMRAEEKAYRLPVLLSVPLVGCMLPVMIGVLLLPASIRVIRTILPAMSGG